MAPRVILSGEQRQQTYPTIKWLGVDPSIGRTSRCIAGMWEYDSQSEVARLAEPLVGEHKDTPAIVDWVVDLEEQHDFNFIAIDAIGLGRGVLDYLQATSFGPKVFAFVASQRPSRDWEKAPNIKHGNTCDCEGCLADRSYVNYKTRVAHTLRKNAYQGKVIMPQHDFLERDMLGYNLVKVGERYKLNDPEDVSPDYGDAALIGYAGLIEAIPFWIGD